MVNNWREDYRQLKELIAAHGEIQISSNIIAIPEQVRPEFYKIFDKIRYNFVNGYFQALIQEAGNLSQNFNRAKKDIAAQLKVEGITTNVGFNSFLGEPVEFFIRGMFYPLFDLIKGKINNEAFEQTVIMSTNGVFGDIYRLGYIRWVALSLLSQLNADKILAVTPPPVERTPVGPAPQPDAKPVPEPEKTKQFSFERETDPTFIVPDFITHIPLIDRYLSFGSLSEMPLWLAEKVSDKMEWLPLESNLALQSNITIFMADRPGDLRLIADRSRVARPDLIIQCEVFDNWFATEEFQRVMQQDETLKPKMGTYIVTKGDVSKDVYKQVLTGIVSAESKRPYSSRSTLLELENTLGDLGIHIVSVGFNPAKLKPIVDAIISSKL